MDMLEFFAGEYKEEEWNKYSDFFNVLVKIRKEIQTNQGRNKLNDM